ncbi:hypothetical protein KFE98_05790 [bacterium SCSIO 12741]|nr:hypothetical protein KFE98_05790 [bacterium SCSIO 12741]
MSSELQFQGPEIGEEALLKFIPQRPPIVMMDRLLHWEENKTSSGLTIADQNLFCSNGKFLEPGIIENFAQTMALRVGYQYFLMNEPAPTGYIGSFKKLNIHRLPSSGEEIRTDIEVIQEMFGVTLATGKMYSGDELLAEIEMKTVIAGGDSN